MKLRVKYATKERKYHTEHTYSNVSSGWVELEPVRIIRSPCGTGSASNRYYYFADFTAPNDAEFIIDGCIREHISRHFNRHFKPKEFSFVDNLCELNKN